MNQEEYKDLQVPPHVVIVLPQDHPFLAEAGAHTNEAARLWGYRQASLDTLPPRDRATVEAHINDGCWAMLFTPIAGIDLALRASIATTIETLASPSEAAMFSISPIGACQEHVAAMSKMVQNLTMRAVCTAIVTTALTLSRQKAIHTRMKAELN